MAIFGTKPQREDEQPEPEKKWTLPPDLQRVDLRTIYTAQGWQITHAMTIDTSLGEVEAEPGDLLILTAESAPRLLCIAGVTLGRWHRPQSLPAS